MNRFLSALGRVIDHQVLRETASDFAALVALSLFMVAVWLLASSYGQMVLLEAIS